MTEFNLDRFLKAQKTTWKMAMLELRRGKKETHWSWWIFPQVNGLGTSPTTLKYEIKSLDEAKAYLQHEELGVRLRKCAKALLDSGAGSIKDVVYWPDDLKIKSSMTLFEVIGNDLEEDKEVFTKVLEKYFDGERCEYTLEWIAEQVQA